ncbi:MAG: multidrug effflux MFS transporter [Alphaproteobacteria bacterium]|nr:multidrug effflux MFS transporter [Alphaproteobacteria bacterium]
MTSAKPALPFAEFVVLLAFMVSIVAMATDIMLPALALIGADLRIADPNDTQLIVSSLFLGFAIGQMIMGPLSDSYGRRPVILYGYLVFIVGCLLSITASDLATMLVGRCLQGIGAAAPRVVGVSLIRDGYAGRAMARIMSIIMSVFILVPALAPALGQGIILVLPWEYTFVLLLAMAVAAALWFGVRQPETLARENRRELSFKKIFEGIAQALRIRTVLGYTLAAGFIFGAFLTYLATSRQVFQEALAVGEMFAVYFGVAALAIGSASALNSMLVMRFGMRMLTHTAMTALVIVSGGFTVAFLAFDGLPPLPLFIAWQLAAFFCIGFLFGNLNALAMEPLGHMAGLGAALIGSISTFISLPFGWMMGQLFDGTVIPLVSGFFGLGLCALILARWTERKPAAGLSSHGGV